MIARLKQCFRAGSAWGLNLLSRLSARRVGLVLVYHRVGDPQQEPDDRLVPSLGTRMFEAQIRHLSRRYRLVAASELHCAVRDRKRGQRLPVAITFDDDLPSHTRAAMPVLRRADVPATFFLSGASLSEPLSFWWERLQLAYDRGLLDEAEVRTWTTAASSRPPVGDADIQSIAAAIEAMPAARREQVARTLLERLGGDPADAGMRADDVHALAAAGFEVGFHTRRHDLLTSLGDEALTRALQEGRAELASAAGQDLSMIAYPHGKANRRVARAARAARYRFGFTTDPRPVRVGADPMLIGRLYPSYEPLGHFALQVARAVRFGP